MCEYMDLSILLYITNIYINLIVFYENSKTNIKDICFE